MPRYINLADAKGRNAEIIMAALPKKSAIKTITPEGKLTHTVRVLKGASQNSFEGMLKQFGSEDAIAAAMLDKDPEVDFQLTGRIIRQTSKLFISEDLKPVGKVSKKEIVYLPDGTVKEERQCKELPANIAAEFPVKPTGKLFPKKEVYNKLVFARKYQLRHVNGLTFDFLFNMAKELHEKDSIMMVAAGEKGNEPLVFQDGGKTYRAFLEGRIKDDTYLLLLHLTNLELKSVV
jgi:hypothetical protein